MAADGKIHTVEKGETLESISKQYYGGTDGWSAIQKANSLPGPVIWPGERLIIPGVEPDLSSPGSEAEPSPAPLPAVVKHPLLTLSSGQSLTAEQVTLYDGDLVREIAELRAKAVKNLGGFSSGIGFLGSPEWALGGAAALGLIEGLISNSMKSQAIEILQGAQQKAESLTKSGKLFDIAKIENLGVPDPQAWGAIAKVNSKTKRFVHNGSEFISIVTAEAGLVHIRWSGVVSYSPPQLESR